MMSVSPTSQLARKPGRPRRISLEALIDAACELEIDRIDMGQLAERLGVGVGTLYRLVRSREHLVELVAARRSRRSGIVDRGQSWQDVIRESAASAFGVYSKTPELVGHIMTGSIADETDPEAAERLLKLLVVRGFTPVQALRLHQQVQQLVIGAVVATSFQRAMEAKFGGYSGLIHHVASTLGGEAIPTLYEAIERGGEPTSIGDYKTPLELVIQSYENKSKTTTPDPRVGRSEH
jgi:AcrR family transcriptional regulator